MKELPKMFNVKKKTNWFLTIFVSIWVIGLIFIIGVISYGLITTPSRIDDLIAVLIFMILIAFLAIDYLRWQLRGQEIIIFDEAKIEIKNSGTFFTSRTIINYFEAENIEPDTDEDTPKLIKFWGIGGGKIKIEYLGRRKRFGQDLTPKEAERIGKEMKLEIERRK